MLLKLILGMNCLRELNKKKGNKNCLSSSD
jgi:hypothetical protein